MPNELRLYAVEASQSPGRTLYSFAVDGKLVHRFAAISRVSRQEGQLKGYQRPEVLSHIEGIRDYIESPSPMVPNAVVLAFDSRVRFEALDQKAAPSADSAYSRLGVLVIPLGKKELPDERKPGFIVDGQQRLAAIRDATVDHFPICVTAFITDDIRHQTEQFILVNSTKPLPKGLIYELIPKTDAQLPPQLRRRRLPAQLMEQLNLDSGSPFHGLIHTATNPMGVIKDNSILKMLENSLMGGALRNFHHSATGKLDLESMLKLLNNYWTAVRNVFKASWGLAAKKSRLMHGVGIVSMGYIMDTISDRLQDTPIPTVEQFQEDLEPLKDLCHWTTGTWNFGNGERRKWNALQNMSNDIDLLTDHLVAQYMTRVWNRTAKARRAAARR
ncbi:MAG TPA: DGQHR domain-containing protein DpdB [Archangium sp.]|nr:DGQHR domain-containing protein DpdB [Archangium sp.]